MVLTVLQRNRNSQLARTARDNKKTPDATRRACPFYECHNVVEMPTIKASDDSISLESEKQSDRVEFLRYRNFYIHTTREILAFLDQRSSKDTS